MPSITYHNHHIVPKHAGGTDETGNLVRLTIPGHAFAHWCLWMKFGRLQDKLAWFLLSGRTEEGEAVREQHRLECLRSPETKAKLRASHLGHLNSPETRAKLSVAHMGRLNSPETRAKISAAKIGIKRQPFSLETRANMSKGKMGNKNCLGRKLSPEHRANISAGLKRKHSLILAP